MQGVEELEAKIFKNEVMYFLNSPGEYINNSNGSSDFGAEFVQDEIPEQEYQGEDYP